jgi:hypothetical protein
LLSGVDGLVVPCLETDDFAVVLPVGVVACLLGSVVEMLVRGTCSLFGTGGLLAGLLGVVTGKTGLLAGLLGVVTGKTSLLAGLLGVETGKTGLLAGLLGVVTGTTGLLAGLLGVVTGTTGLLAGLLGVVTGATDLLPGLLSVEDLLDLFNAGLTGVLDFSSTFSVLTAFARLSAEVFSAFSVAPCLTKDLEFLSCLVLPFFGVGISSFSSSLSFTELPVFSPFLCSSYNCRYLFIETQSDQNMLL